MTNVFSFLHKYWRFLFFPFCIIVFIIIGMYESSVYKNLEINRKIIDFEIIEYKGEKFPAIVENGNEVRLYSIPDTVFMQGDSVVKRSGSIVLHLYRNGRKIGEYE
jgi:hypothetical protein